MTLQELTPRKRRATAMASALALLSSTMPMSAETPAKTVKNASTQTPIQHVIVIIGENRTFDHIFGTYQPVAGQTINNLLSEGIVRADGTPGPNFSIATQDSAVNKLQNRYQINPCCPLLWWADPARLTSPRCSRPRQQRTVFRKSITSTC
jgi:phospholipase C